MSRLAGSTIVATAATAETARIGQVSQVNVLDGALVLQLFYGTFTKGGSGTASFSLENTGGAEIEIVTATGSGSSASNEVVFHLVDSDGNVLAYVPVKQALGQYVETLPGGVTVARIPANAAFTSGPIQRSGSVKRPGRPDASA